MDIDQSLDLKRDTWFDRIVLDVATFLFIMIILLATVQVVVRVFELPISGGAWWTTPLARYTLIFGTFFGAAVASRNGEHIKMTILRDAVAKRAPRLGTAIDLIAQSIVVGFLGLAAYAAVIAASGNWGDRLLDLPINSGYVYVGITIGITVTLLYELYNMYTLITGTETGDTIAGDGETDAVTGGSR